MAIGREVRLSLQKKGKHMAQHLHHEAANEFRPPDAAQGNEKAGVHLVLALLIAALIVFGARQLTNHLVLRTAALPLAAQVNAIAAPSGETAASPATSNGEDDEIVAAARKERQLREQTLMEQDRARREQKKAEIMRARDEEVAASQAEETRKEAAWERFFVQSKKCSNVNDDAMRVDCSNQYIRAKERFEKLYAEGKLH